MLQSLPTGFAFYQCLFIHSIYPAGTSPSVGYVNVLPQNCVLRHNSLLKLDILSDLVNIRTPLTSTTISYKSLLSSRRKHYVQYPTGYLHLGNS